MSTQQLNKILLNSTILKNSLRNSITFVYFLKKQTTITTVTAED